MAKMTEFKRGLRAQQSLWWPWSAAEVTTNRAATPVVRGDLPTLAVARAEKPLEARPHAQQPPPVARRLQEAWHQRPAALPHRPVGLFQRRAALLHHPQGERFQRRVALLRRPVGLLRRQAEPPQPVVQRQRRAAPRQPQAVQVSPHPRASWRSRHPRLTSPYSPLQ